MQNPKTKKRTVGRSKSGRSPYGPQERAIRMLISTVEEYHRGWLRDRPKGSLEDLLSHLTAAMEECEALDDELILDHLDSVGAELGHELAQWTIEDGETFEYRLANLEEYVGEIEELIEVFGSAFIVTKLPKLPAPQIAAAAKRLAA